MSPRVKAARAVETSVRPRFSSRSFSDRSPLPNASGFTLVEALISSLVMAFAAIAMAGLYFAGLQASSAQTESAQIDSLLRSRMEYLLSEKIDSPNLADGNEEVTIDGKTYTVSWTVVGVDLDDDGQVETDAKRIEVSVAGRSATTLVVDTGETLGKI